MGGGLEIISELGGSVLESAASSVDLPISDEEKDEEICAICRYAKRAHALDFNIECFRQKDKK